MITAHLTQSYDEFPYYSRAFPESHPAHLATIGQLFGMSPARVSECRVLELGCASGGNLIPMAVAFPHSQFLGIDISSEQVKQGKAQIQQLQLTNIALVADNLATIDESWGQFDYMIAHGVYSWVPETIREQILRLCRNHLTEQGIAYISYNTYPGWHLREMVRDLLLYATADETAPQQRVDTAKTIARQFASICDSQQIEQHLFQQELNRLQTQPDSHLFHEYLEAVNTPFYFHDFINQAQHYHLQYLADALFSRMFESDLSPQAQQMLQQLAPDLITAEQYKDFFRNQKFRQTLLCHEDVKLERYLKAEVVEPLMVASSAQPTRDRVNVYDGTEVAFQTSKGAVLRSSNPVTKLALSYLGQCYPEMMSFAQLWHQVQQDLGITEGRKQLATDLLRGFSVDLVTLSCEKAGCQKQVSNYPMAWSIARQQAQFQSEVVNPHHQMVSVSPYARQLLPYLDGRRDRANLAQQFQLSATTVEQTLAELAQLGVLVS